jgi:hypothetical protein
MAAWAFKALPLDDEVEVSWIEPATAIEVVSWLFCSW